MPDLVEDATGRVRRSRTRFRLVMTAAILAAVLALGSFAFSLLGNWQHTNAATAEAHAAAVQAQAATRRANQAAAAAENALDQSQVTVAHLCVFLGLAERNAPDEVARDATDLARLYHCPKHE